MSAKFDSGKAYTYLKGFAMGREWKDTISALSYARVAHKDQVRKSGEPYIIHPLTVAAHGVSLGLYEDEIIASAILHDVVEDCNVDINSLPVSCTVKDAVHRLTHIKGEPLEPYYREISENRISALVKLLDRCDNVSSMAGVFSVQKIRQYIEETRNFVLPLIRRTKDQWPSDSNVLFVLKYHIMAVIDGLEVCLNITESQESKETKESKKVK